MRYVLVTLMIAVLGAMGIWRILSQGETGATAATAAEAVDTAAQPNAAASPHGTPAAAVDEPEHDFGVMDVQQEAQHTFVLRNTGDAPLKLKRAHSTCKCTVARVTQTEVAPGAAADVVLSWKTEPHKPHFSHSVRIATNDPKQPEVTLIVRGKVRALLRVTPAHIDLPAVRRDEARAFQALVYSQAWPDFAVTAKVADDENLVVEVDEASDDVRRAHDAVKAFRITGTLAPSNEAGRFYKLIQLVVDPRDGVSPRQTENVIVEGEVLGGVKIYGEGLLCGRLDLGTLYRGEARRKTLSIVVRDEPFDLGVERIECDPAFLQAKVERVGQPGGRAALYRLAIEVPATAPLCSYGLNHPAEVRIVTRHPSRPELAVKVQFVVMAK